jgi:2,3-bisphosphoglycerate-dependent phosphoglycerate mutase
MSVLLIRHGETALNVARVLQPADTPLSARGLAQAEALARRLARVPGLRGLICSDLPRALGTAAAIAAATGLVLETTPLLHERNFGDWRGQPRDAFSVNPLTMAEAPPGGESAATFAMRVSEAFALLRHRQATLGGTLAVVTHGLVIREVLATHAQLGVGTPLPLHFGNTSVTEIADAPPHAVLLLDCTEHLEADNRDSPSGLAGG